jgi:hypothetical protein
MVRTRMEKAELVGVRSPVSHIPVVASNEGRGGEGEGLI